MTSISQRAARPASHANEADEADSTAAQVAGNASNAAPAHQKRKSEMSTGARSSQDKPRKTHSVSAADLSGKALVAGPRFDVRGADVDLSATLSLMAPEINEWLETTCADLQNALASYFVEGGKASRQLLNKLHELRGQAGTMGFPLVARIAAALHLLLEGEPSPPPEVLTAHVDAIRAIVSEDARAMTSPLAVALTEALEEFGRVWSASDFGNGSESSF